MKRRLPGMKYIVVDVHLKSGQTVRLKCKSFEVSLDSDHVSKWTYKGSKGDDVWFVPSQIAAYKLVRRTWW